MRREDYSRSNDPYRDRVISLSHKAVGVLLLAVLCAAVLTGCLSAAGRDDTADSAGIYDIYCLDRDENTLVSYEYRTQETATERVLAVLVEELGRPSEDVRRKEAVSGFEITGIDINERQLTVSVSEAYKKLPPVREVLTRAAIVRTLGQAEGIDYISFKVMGEDLTDALGQPVGLMNPAGFVDNAGNEINSYENIELILYFADEEGTGLVRTVRTVEYNTNISLEKLTVEQLLLGTTADGVQSAVNPQTELINVTVKDGTCYVNLGIGFLTLPEGVRPEVTIYSIVNSLAELSGIGRVQFSIDGNSDVMLGDAMSLSGQYERNLDIVR